MTRGVGLQLHTRSSLQPLYHVTNSDTCLPKRRQEILLFLSFITLFSNLPLFNIHKTATVLSLYILMNEKAANSATTLYYDFVTVSL